MIAWRARPTRRVERHMALVEAAVAEYADRLWQRAAAQRLRWLRRVLRRIRPALERLIVIRTPRPEEVLLEQLIRQAGLEFPPPDAEALAGDLAELGRRISLQYGFLPNDPRAATLEREFRELLEGDLSSYWRSLTDPRALARRLAELREQNRSTAQIIRTVQQEYGAGYFSAERLVRTLYNSGANRAQFEALKAQGYTHKRWLTARDSRVRTASKGSRFDHRRMEGVTVPIEQPFVTPAGSRLMYPGDRRLGAPAGEVVNCRCTIVGVMAANPSAGGGQSPNLVQAALAGARPAGMIQMHGMSFAEDMQEVLFQGNRYLFTPSTRTALEATLKELATNPLPEALRGRTDRVVFTKQRNKDDAYWERVYNIPGFVSDATGGDGHVVVYGAQPISRSLLAHEMGHNLAAVIYGSTRYRPSSDYAAAVAAGEPPVSSYGAVAPAEDFAEAVRLYVEDPQQLKARAPKKFRVIDRLMNEVGYGG